MKFNLKVPLKRGLTRSLRGEASTGGGGGIPINPFDAYYNTASNAVYAGMAAPVGNLFDVGYATSGNSIYAGISAPPVGGLPTWQQGLGLYEIVAIPHVGPLSSIDPENDPLTNPNHPNASPWRGSTGFAAVVNGYGGAAYDDTTGKWWYILQGGHQDYAGNPPFMVDVFANTIQWKMARKPSGAIGNVINLNDGQSATGLYSDGRLRSTHAYSYNFAHNGKLYVAALVASFPDVGLIRKVYEVDPITGEATLVCDYSTDGTNNTGYGGAAIDPVSNKMFISGQGTIRPVVVDLNTKTFTNLGYWANIFGSYSTAVYAPEPARIIFACAQVTTDYLAKRGLAIINPATNAITYPACENFPSFLGGAVGAAWIGDKLLLWDNAVDTNKFAALTPSNPADLSQPWTVSVITGTGAMPTARASTGTYSKLQYSARLGGVLLHNGVTQQMYFMRTK
jgi:hypothetical protein